MPTSLRQRLAFVPGLPFMLFTVFMIILFVAGGASRADVWGQVVVRAAATLILIVAILFGPRLEIAETRPLWIILACCILLPALQLIPLPPAIWQALPGRSLLSQAAILNGESQPWRPVSMVPGATLNAFGSLLVPLATLVLISQLSEEDRRRTPGLTLLIIATSMLIGLMQFSGVSIASPFGDHGQINVNGFFDNRNHFALLLAMGCTLAPVWAFSSRRQQRWRAPVALGLAVLFALTILASGSRAGMAVGFLGLILGAVIVRHQIGHTLARFPRWAARTIIAAATVAVVAAVALSVLTNRAVSINRALANNTAEDMRGRAFPTVMEIAEKYFPAGTGYGSFDPVFRIHEPFALLSSNYFNHAHNDLLEVVMDGGIMGLMLLLGALFWWGVTTYRVWRPSTESRKRISRMGSAVILLAISASAVDYPARTPLMMAILIVAASWLSMKNAARDPALPPTSPLL